MWDIEVTQAHVLYLTVVFCMSHCVPLRNYIWLQRIRGFFAAVKLDNARQEMLHLDLCRTTRMLS